MISTLSGLPDGVIGFEITGKVTKEDYTSVVVPAVEEAARSGDVRFVVVIPEFHGMSAGALGQDLKVAFENFRKWKRIAVVSDVEWIHHLVSLFGWMTPGDLATFAMAERDKALTWVAG
jgi:hypothetical protein